MENSKYNESEIGHSDIDKFPIANELIGNELIGKESIDENTRPFQLSRNGKLTMEEKNTSQNNTKSLAKKEDQVLRKQKQKEKQRLNSEEEAFKKKLKFLSLVL